MTSGSTKVSSSAANKRTSEGLSRGTKSEEDYLKDSLKKDGSVKVLNIPDVGLYEGHFLKGMPHGDGKLKLKNGDTYEGQFQNGLFQGQGKMITADGCEYEGQWLASQRDGQGEEKWPNGNIYVGGFKEDRKDGYGKIMLNIQASLLGLTEAIMKVSSSKESTMDSEYTIGKMEKCMKETGKKERCMVKAKFSTPTATSTKALFIKEGNMAKACSNGPKMEHTMMGNGTIMFPMVLVLQGKIANLAEKQCTRMVKTLPGLIESKSLNQHSSLI